MTVYLLTAEYGAGMFPNNPHRNPADKVRSSTETPTTRAAKPVSTLPAQAEAPGSTQETAIQIGGSSSPFFPQMGH